MLVNFESKLKAFFKKNVFQYAIYKMFTIFGKL